MTFSIWETVKNSVATSVMQSQVIGMIDKYAGKDCKNLRLAILLNTDILEVYKANAESNGELPFEKVKAMAMQYREVGNRLTKENVLKWLIDAKKDDIVWMVQNTPGGELWLDGQLQKVRRELFGQD